MSPEHQASDYMFTFLETKHDHIHDYIFFGFLKLIIHKCLSARKHQQQQQQQQQQHHHKMGGRSASGLEELIMGCTSSSSDIKEVSIHDLFLL